MTYRIEILPVALKTIASIRDHRIQTQIRDRIDGLAYEPEQQGKPLGGQLAGFRSLRAASQRYRIIYRVERTRVVVMILTVGLRKEGNKKDVYVLAKKLLRLGLV